MLRRAQQENLSYGHKYNLREGEGGGEGGEGRRERHFNNYTYNPPILPLLTYLHHCLFDLQCSRHFPTRPFRIGVDENTPLHGHITLGECLLLFPVLPVSKAEHLLVDQEHTFSLTGTLEVVVSRARACTAANGSTRFLAQVTTL